MAAVKTNFLLQLIVMHVSDMKTKQNMIP